MRKSTKLVSIILSAVLFASVPMNHVVDAEDNAKTAAKNDITVTETVDELAQETILDDKEDLESDSLYTTKRLIVVSDESAFETHEADFVISYGNMYILSYDTEKQCKNAYKKLKKDETILSVDIDAVMETEENTGTAEKVVDIDSSAELGAANVSGTEENVLKTHLNSLEAVAEVKVAILDTGIDTSMELFADRIIDLGLNLSSSGEENSIEDDNGHGTEMATIICDNSNENVKLMPIKIANADGKATVLNTYLGIKYAMENDADVINISMNTVKSATSQILTDIIDEATEQGITVVVSAGNNSMNTADVTPANVEAAIVVGAVNNENTYAKYSNHGNTMDYVSYGTYEDKTGTSYAAASVTGILADLLSKEQEVDTLSQYAVDLGDEGYDIFYGNGFIGLYSYVSDDVGNDGSNDDSIEDTEHNAGNSGAELENNADENYNILKLGDGWKDINTEEFQKYLDNSEPWEIGKYLEDLDEEAYEPVMEKFPRLSENIEVVDFCGEEVTGARNCKYYEFCNSEYLKYAESLTVSADKIYTEYKTTTGSFKLNIKRYDQRSIDEANAATDNEVLDSKYIAYCTVSIVLEDKKTGTNYNNELIGKNKGSITLTGKSTNWDTYAMGFTLTSGEMKMSPADRADYEAELGTHREILLLKGSYKLPQYCYAESENTNKDDKDYGRLTFYQYKDYGSFDDAVSTLIGTAAGNTDSGEVTDEFEIQALIRQCGITYSGDTTSPVDNGTLHLKIRRSIYTVTTKTGTGVDSATVTNNVTTTSGTTVQFRRGETATINATLSTGYHWGNWSNTTLLPSQNNASVTILKGGTYTATGIINSSTLTINPNGGTWSNDEGDISPITYPYGKTISVPDPTIDNYTVKFNVNSIDGVVAYKSKTTDKDFDGWEDVAGDKVIIGATGAYAGTFDTTSRKFTYGEINNGTGTLTATWKGSYVVPLPTATRTGYTCNGWYTAASGGDYIGPADGTGTYTASSDKELYAQWTPITYYVAYNGNGATNGSMENSTHTYDDKNSKLSANKYKKIYAVTFNDNYTDGATTTDDIERLFDFWAGSNYKTYSDGADALNLTSIQGDTITMSAEWKEATVTMPSRTRDGYDFLGWNEDENATAATYEKDKQIEVTKNTTYYAIWKEIEYDIVYDMNGGTGTPVTDTKKYFTDYTVKSDTECGYTREGYVFVEWATEPDVDPLAENFQIEEEYQPGQILDETIINDNNENIHDRKLTLYAVWMPLIKIAYMMNNTATTAEANSEYNMSGKNIIDDGENGIGIPMDEGCTIYDNMTSAVQAYALEASEETEENFKMEGIYEYQDNNGNSYTEKVTSTVVGWAFYSDTNADSCDYALAEEVEKTEYIYNAGNRRGNGSITTGTPREEFYENADGQVDPAVPQPENDNTIYANLFAVYAYGPKVHAVPLYYTLHNAQIGYITLDDLLSHVEVFDTEDSNIVAVDTIPAKEDRAEDTTYYTVIDYQPSDFTQLTGDAMVSETYYAVDSAGNVTKKRINVEIVDVDASIQDADPKDGESRFISYKYLWTLKETSIWLTEPYFSQLVSAMHYEEVEPEIKAAYPHIYNATTEALALQMIDVDMTPPIPIFGDMFKHEIRGTRQYDRPPKQVWIFKHEDVLAVKQFVEENGFTTYADKAELDAFLKKFDYCYKYDNGVFRHEGTQEECDFYQRWFGKLGL